MTPSRGLQMVLVSWNRCARNPIFRPRSGSDAGPCWSSTPGPAAARVTGARRTQAEPAFLATGDLWLRTEPPLPLEIDGEIHGETPARITLAPNALRVVVDPGFPDT